MNLDSPLSSNVIHFPVAALAPVAREFSPAPKCRACKPAKVVPGAPRTDATRALWASADRHWLLADHPADCEVCAGATDPDVIVARHAKHQTHLVAKARAAVKHGKTVVDAYYAGGFRLMVANTPIRVAAHVKKWKNRAMLGKGFDAYGLTLKPRGTYGWTAVRADLLNISR